MQGRCDSLTGCSFVLDPPWRGMAWPPPFLVSQTMPIRVSGCIRVPLSSGAKLLNALRICANSRRSCALFSFYLAERRSCSGCWNILDRSLCRGNFIPLIFHTTLVNTTLLFAFYNSTPRLKDTFATLWSIAVGAPRGKSLHQRSTCLQSCDIFYRKKIISVECTL